jgi:hypothetical protein
MAPTIAGRTCMTGPVFVDTNVLVYDRERRDLPKHERAQAWMAALWQGPGAASC